MTVAVFVDRGGEEVFAVGQWCELAKRVELPAAEIELMAATFESGRLAEERTHLAR